MTARFRSKSIADFVVVLAIVAAVAPAAAAAPQSPAAASTDAARADTLVPADYVIGPEDVLSVVFWRDKDMTGDVAVRPDGKISLPLLNNVPAAGLTPAQLRERLIEASSKIRASDMSEALPGGSASSGM